MKFCFFVFASCLALRSAAQHPQTGVEAIGLRGRIARLTETGRTCPDLGWVRRASCIMRGMPEKKYRTARTTHTMNAQGQQGECDHYNADDGLVTKNYFFYDGNGYKTQTVTKGSDGSLLGRVVYRYDKDHYLAGIDYHNAKDSLFYSLHTSELFFDGKTVYEYDRRGKLVSEVRFAHNDIDSIKLNAAQMEAWKTQEQKVYEDAGNVPLTTERNTNGSPKSIAKRVYTYDKDSSITAETIYRYDDFDTEGNWHKVTTWLADDIDDRTRAIVTVITRDIIYYK